MSNQVSKRSLWVWYSDAPHGGYLFEGNQNRVCPLFHLGGIDNIINGERLVCANTRKALEMNFEVAVWDNKFPQFKIKPVSVMVEIRPYYKRKQKESRHD